MNLQTLKERRSKTVKEMRTMTETAATENRDLSEDESSKFDELRSTLNSQDLQIERAEIVATAERSLDAEPGQVQRGDTFEHAKRNFSITKAIAATLEPGRVDAGREFEVSQEIANRSGRKPSGFFMPHEIFQEERAILTSNTGGTLVPTNYRPEMLIDRLRESLQVQALGATILNDLSGNQEIPRLTASTTGYWMPEHGAPSRSDLIIDSLTMAPKTIGAEVEFSRRMLINASPGIERVLRRDIANIIASVIDNAAIGADGTGNQPTGILSTPGIGDVSHGTDGGVPNWDSILNIIDALEVDEALRGQLGWLTNSAVVKKLRSTVKVDSTDSQMVMNDPGTLAGYALRKSSNVPSDGSKGTGSDLSTIIFGNWSDLLIGYWSAVDILVNPFHSDVYSKGGVLINALQDCDIAVRHPESFAAATDVETA